MTGASSATEPGPRHIGWGRLAVACLGWLVPLAVGAAPTAARQLLVEVPNVPAAQQSGGGRFVYDDYHYDRVLSLVHDTALLLATPGELQTLRAEGFDARVVMRSPNPLVLYRRAMYGPTLEPDPIYHTYGQIIIEAAALERLHPRLIHRLRIGETSQFHRDIYAYRISNDAAKVQDRPAVMFDGCHHANEVMGAEVVFALMKELVNGYGRDPAITHWLNTLEIYLVPVVNVDGHNMVLSGHDPRWRKDARDVNGDGVTGDYPEGVDLNRNYDFNWAQGGSGEPSSPRYRGPYPFSEAENRAMRHLANLRSFVLSISYHSSGEVVYYPWTWGGRPAPNEPVIKRIAGQVARAIPTMDGNGHYTIAPGGASSQSYAWFYGRRGDIDMIVEIGRGANLFPPADVPGLIRANLAGAHALLEQAAGPGLSVQVTDASTGRPLEADVWLPRIDNETVDRRHSDPVFGRAWRLLNPGTYDVIVSRKGYHSAALNHVQVAAHGWTDLEVGLEPEPGAGW